MSKSLKKLLKKVFASEAHEELAVADAKLGNVIKEKMEIDCVANSTIQELMRCIREQADSLLEGLEKKEITACTLGLAHSLSRYKLKFSPDKVDTMIVQAISLLDDLDKELNNYAMRCREWYGWHFPEIGKIVTDNLAYAKTIQAIGKKDKCAETDLSSILPEDVEAEVKAAAEISMGTDMADEDVVNVNYLCDQIIQISEYRMTLYDCLRNRMQAIAPNLTVLVGELVGARLISHAGSLLNLAKHPASTVQILGAEKALFRALKTKHDTPKYGIIYHAQVVGQASAPLKGKASRMLAAKAALACRAGALFESLEANNKKVELDAEFVANRERIEKGELGMKGRSRVESRLKMLEGGNDYQVSGTGKAQAKFDKYEAKSEIQEYKTAADNTMKVSKKRKFSENEAVEEEVVKIKAEDQTEADEEPKKKKKKKKDKQKDAEAEEQE